MNIYVDGTPVFRKLDGVGRYCTSLMSALASVDKDNNYRILGFFDDRNKPHSIDKSLVKYEYIPQIRKAYSQWYKRMGPVSVNRMLKKTPDLVIYPNFVNFPKIKDTPSILIIHDLAYIEAPETISAKNLKYLAKFVPKAITESSAVVAVSEETQIAIAKHYAVNASDITVVPNAVDANFFTKISDADNKRTTKKYKLPDDYILFLGTLEPRKNLVRLLEAYSQLPSELVNRHPLVLAGNPGWKNKEILNKIDELTANGFNIHKIGFVEDKDLPALFDLAKLFVFPSIHEGFGLPILEAMAAGTPVVTSNLPPMNRIAKDVAMFVEPEQVGSIKNAIERVLSSKRIANSMSSRGRKMADGYTWENSAQIMLELIARVRAK